MTRLALTLALIYSSAMLSYRLSVQSITIVWLPSGVLLALLVASAPRRWLPLLIGAYLGNLGADYRLTGNLVQSLLGPLANLAESVLAATVLGRLGVGRDLLESLRGVGALVVGAAVLSNAVTALFGAGILGHFYGGSPLRNWLVWWVGDGLGMLLATPAVLGMLDGLSRARLGLARPRRVAEGVVLFAGLAVLAGIAFGWEGPHDPYVASGYLLFPVLMLMAIRLGVGSAAMGLALASGIALWHTALGHGPLVRPGEQSAQTVFLYVYVTLSALIVLVPAGALAERAAAVARVGESEARYRALVDTARDAILTIGGDRRIRFANPEAERLLGMPPAGLVGRAVTDFVAPADGPELLARLDALGAGAGAAAGEGLALQVRRADGSEVAVEMAIGVSEGPEGRLFTAIARDVSARRRLEEELRHAQRLEALGRITGGLAHEYRNQLTVILGNLHEALLEAPAGGIQRELLLEVRAAAEQGQVLTQQMLAFGRRQALAPEPLDLEAAVAHMVSLLRPVLGRSIEITVEATHAGPNNVHADRAALQQVFLNLALNARDAMPNGGRLVLVTGRAEPDPDQATRLGLTPGRGYGTVEVRDTGPGMDEATLDRVFEPFFTTKAGGTGLGLATVYGIVRQSGGAIRVESALGRGTAFRVYLPAA